MSSFASRARRVLIALAVVALNACSSSSGLTEPGPGRPHGQPANCPEPDSCPINLSTGSVIAASGGTIAHASAPIVRSA